MKKSMLMLLTIALLVLITSSSVWAHGRYYGNRFNLGLNLGYYNPGYYGNFGYVDPFFYPPYYPYPPVVVMPSAPPVYFQQEQTAPVQPKTQYWYYCRNPDGYYPYVKQCPEGWLQVSPQPTQ